MKNKLNRFIYPTMIALILVGVVLLATPESRGRAAASGATIMVNSLDDNLKNDGSCTLREAIISANKDQPSGSKNGECAAGSGADTIEIPLIQVKGTYVGTYVLTRTDNGKEDSSSTGDLDILDDVTIRAVDPGIVILGENGFTDRIFHVLGGHVTIEGVTISGGNVKESGGAIYNLSTLSLEKSTLVDNQAVGGGGGIYNAGTLTVANSTLSRNTAASDGGGLFNNGSSNVNNTTITKNSADSDGDGLGDGGGIKTIGGTLNVSNTIIAGNTDASPNVKHKDCSGTIVSQGHNLIQDLSGCSGTSDDDQTGVDPILGLLQNNGGPTETYALSAGSPAIDAGNPAVPGSIDSSILGKACEITDQRGISRPQRSRCDIGAFEVVNTPPSAVNDTYSVDEDDPLEVTSPGILSNDSDVDLDVLASILKAGPSHGILKLNTDGTFSYTPSTNFNGADNFTYAASDGFGESNIATVAITINPVNDAPVADSKSIGTDEDVAVEFTLTASDIEGDPITYVIVDEPSNGKLSGTPPNLTYTPNLNFNGDDAFTFKVNDGKLDSDVATGTITVNPVNDPPVAVDDAYSVDEDGTLNVGAPGVSGNDQDIDGDALTTRVDANPTYGELTLNVDGSFTYTPGQNFNGTDTFAYYANDGLVDSNLATATIKVNPDPYTEVTNSNDSGPGSLRQAILDTNQDPNQNIITFEIPGSGPFTISLQSALPAIIDPVLLDGLSQANGELILDGTSAGPGVDGLVITAGNSTVGGLKIVNFDGNGILLETNGNNTVEQNTIANNGGSGISVLSGSTNNLISNNNIYGNTGLAIDLGGDGSTSNDIGDSDDGANDFQNYPMLVRATPGSNGLTVNGLLNSQADAEFIVEFFSSETCSLSGSGIQFFLGSKQVTTDSGGNSYFEADGLAAIPEGTFVSATATDPLGNTSEFSPCITVGAANDSWPTSMNLDVLGNSTVTKVDQFVDLEGQSRWYKFKVQPNSQLIVTLTNLPANYDLTIYKDIAQAYKQLASPQDLVRLGAEFAPAQFSPAQFSPAQFSPAQFSPAQFSPAQFSPAQFSPAAFSPAQFSPAQFSPAQFSPAQFSPAQFSPAQFSPDAISPAQFSPAQFSPAQFSPAQFSPAQFSPAQFSPEAFSSAQTRSLIGVSAFDGTAGEGLVLNSWNEAGDFYVRVRGRDGAFSLDAPFHLEVRLVPGSCDKVQPISAGSSITPISGGNKTIILVDSTRMDLTSFQDKLDEFKNRLEVKGVLVDVGQDDKVSAANEQADQYFGCPYAKNLVANAIKEIVDGYWNANPDLQYVVIIGSDRVIPFFRYRDNALLGPESQYVPPVQDFTASQASLKLNYVLSQDAYGASQDVSVDITDLPMPELAVGRLVEKPSEILAMLNAYLATSGGVVPQMSSSLVTGYDFLEDAAQEIKKEFTLGIGQAADELIADRTWSPEDPRSWTADQLREKLLNSRHDLIFLAGHFSAVSALAADYKTSMLTTDLTNSSADFTNVIVFSAGCHSGYNIVNQDGVPGITFEPDWAQAFASMGATFIGGTGYQYGDTDFLEYSERLYLEFAKQLRAYKGADGSDPVSVGEALVAAKRAYLANTPQLRGIHEKAVLEATLFGLPMLSVKMPGSRLNPSAEEAIVTATNSFGSNPGDALGLEYADVTITPDFSDHIVQLKNAEDGTTEEGFYLSGSQGEVSNPAEPVLPLEIRSASFADMVLRGVGFRGGQYTDLQGILPVVGAPTTEIRGVHTPFLTSIFYPVKPWSVNYFDALSNESGGITKLMVTPAQFRSDLGSSHGTLRKFTSLDLRLYYSNNTEVYTGDSGVSVVPGLSDAPAITQISAVPGSTSVDFSVNVVGNPAAGIQEVWVTYTVCPAANLCDGTWQSLSLSQQANSTVWMGTLPLNQNVSPQDIRYLVQAANGVGLVSMATNLGAYYIPGVDTNPASTQLTIDSTVTSGAYGSLVPVTARLTSGGSGASNQVLSFCIGPLCRQAITDGSGNASATIPLLALPGKSDLNVFFTGSSEYQANFASRDFTVTKQTTSINLDSGSATRVRGDDILVTATLTDTNDLRLGEFTLFFVLSGNGTEYCSPVITDYLGRASLKNPSLLPIGTYNVTVAFSGDISLCDGQSISLNDDRYEPSTASGTLNIVNQAPIAEDDSYGVNEDDLLALNAPGILSNDSDPDGDPLTVSAVNGNSGNLGQQITLESGALLTVSQDGDFTYDPNGQFEYLAEGQTAVDNYTYTIDDGHVGSATATVTITIAGVNDPPTDITLSDSSIAENQPAGTAVGTFITTDVDGGPVYYYSLISGEGDSDNASFTISGDTLVSGAAFDFETQNSYSIRVQTDDGSGGTFAKQFTISITDVNDPPTDITLSDTTIAENQPVGTAVGTFTTTDVDGGPDYSYSLVSGEGDSDNASFTISGDTLVSSAAFDFETQNIYSILVQTDDGNGGTFANQFTISITDVNDPPTDIALSNSSIAENQPAGTAVGTFTTTDVDGGSVYAYSLVSGVGDSDNAAFAITGDTLVSGAAFDFETQNSYSILVQTDDGNGGTFAKQFTISITNVNESPTDIALSDSSIAENQPAGTAVGTFITIDVDGGPSYTYTLISGEGDSDNASFNISGDTLVSNAAFDFETQNSYSILVQTDDGNGGTFAKRFTISITDVNDDPICDGAMPSLGYWIWPPSNTTLVPVNVIDVTDPDGDQISITIDGIWQDEPVGTDSNSPDGFGLGTDTALVRAERDGSGDGRVYHIYFTASDGNGGTCSVTYQPDQLHGGVRVGVFDNQGDDLDPIDQGPLYDSTIRSK